MAGMSPINWLSRIFLRDRFYFPNLRLSHIWIIWLAFLLGALVPSHGNSSNAPLQVMVTIPPQKYIVEQIGGSLVKVTTFVPESADPHSFEPTPRIINQLKNTQLFVAVGTLNVERKWLPRFQKMFPHLIVLSMAQALYKETTTTKRSPIFAPEGINPHIWLSPPIVLIHSRALYSALIKFLPNNVETLEKNTLSWCHRLAQIDLECIKAFAPYQNRAFLVYHPAWFHFARAYDLIQLSVEKEGKNPGQKELAKLIRKISKNNIKTLFVQSKPAPVTAQRLAKQLGLNIRTLNPLSYDWCDIITKAKEAFTQSLQNSSKEAEAR